LIIKFNKIVVDTIESDSGIFIGDNDVSGWCSINKTQELVAGIKGMNNNVEVIKGIIDDSDLLDMPTKERVCFQLNQGEIFQNAKKNSKKA
jgi:hypothetical protein